MLEVDDGSPGTHRAHQRQSPIGWSVVAGARIVGVLGIVPGVLGAPWPRVLGSTAAGARVTPDGSARITLTGTGLEYH